jgi:hypothetical protein
MALREGNSALRWAVTRPEDNTPATAVAVGQFVGHFVQVGPATVMGRIVASYKKRPCLRCAQAGSEPDCSRVWISFRGSIVPQSRPNAQLLTPADTIVQRVPLRPGSIQTPKAHEVGPRVSEFPGRPSSVEVPVCYSEGGKARILGISSNPNLKT